MLRMASRIAADGVFVLDNPRWDEEERHRVNTVASEIQRIAETSVSVIADNIDEYLMRVGGGEFIRPELAPMPMPALDEMIIEWKVNGHRVIGQCAAIIISQDAEECPFVAPPGGFRRVVIHGVAECGGRAVYDGSCNMWWCSRDGTIVGDVAIAGGWSSGEYPVAIPMATLSFMNCKNVADKDVTESEGPSAKWIRRQKAPTIRYHVLDINPMKEVLRTEGIIEANGLKKALHIRRGHFRRGKRPFGRDKPETMWISSHVRGSAEHGIVDKDYRVVMN